MNNFRVLVISGNCLSKHNSNGRTLLNLLHGISKENIYQIYTSGEYPTDDLAAAYLRVSNRDVVSSILKCKGVFTLPMAQKSENNAAVGSAGNKNALTMLGRDLVWDAAHIEHNAIINWAKKVAPKCILLQLGDSALQITLALRISTKLNIPIVTYNTEDYYFKDYDYMKRSMTPGLFYRFFHRRFRNKLKALMKHTSACIYNCDGLKALYDLEFNTPSYAVLPVSDFLPDTSEKKERVISYAGNLGVGRHRSLMRLAECLQKMDPDLHIDVYGNATTEIIEDFEKCVGIRYHGFVSYEEVCRIMNDSSLLLHIESFDSYYQTDTRFAFSTKLVDCLKSGVLTFLYAPSQCEASVYFRTHRAAFVAASEEEMQSQLSKALFDHQARSETVRNAVALSEMNHNIETNSQLVLNILKDSYQNVH